jgi:hypothetical protein
LENFLSPHALGSRTPQQSISSGFGTGLKLSRSFLKYPKGSRWQSSLAWLGSRPEGERGDENTLLVTKCRRRTIFTNNQLEKGVRQIFLLLEHLHCYSSKIGVKSQSLLIKKNPYCVLASISDLRQLTEKLSHSNKTPETQNSQIQDQKSDNIVTYPIQRRSKDGIGNKENIKQNIQIQNISTNIKIQTIPITPQQQQILPLLYRFRFLDRSQIQKSMNHKNHKRILIWLNDLNDKIRRYEST